MTIGRYKLLEKIGEGGMAAVYMAEQKRPIRRKIALKIIKLGMDTKQVIARFESHIILWYAGVCQDGSALFTLVSVYGPFPRK